MLQAMRRRWWTALVLVCGVGLLLPLQRPLGHAVTAAEAGQACGEGGSAGIGRWFHGDDSLLTRSIAGVYFHLLDRVAAPDYSPSGVRRDGRLRSALKRGWGGAKCGAERAFLMSPAFVKSIAAGGFHRLTQQDGPSPYAKALIQHYLKGTQEPFHLESMGEIPKEWQQFIASEVAGQGFDTWIRVKGYTNDVRAAPPDLQNSLGTFEVSVHESLDGSRTYRIRDIYEFAPVKTAADRHGYSLGRMSTWERRLVQRLLPATKYETPGGIVESFELQKADNGEICLLVPQQFLEKAGKPFEVEGSFVDSGTRVAGTSKRPGPSTPPPACLARRLPLRSTQSPGLHPRKAASPRRSRHRAATALQNSGAPPGREGVLLLRTALRIGYNGWLLVSSPPALWYRVVAYPKPTTETIEDRRTMASVEHIRNVAIIAHIDHGKTTLIDSIFRATRVFRANAHVAERVMDSNELERERGITIRAKHCTVEWNGYRINIIDTPGHADFSGEVERILSMVDSVLLLVDANEGPMPQTRYVLMRALRLGLRPIVIVNKADRPHADPHGALDETFDLFVELGATDEQCDFPVLYGSGLHGWIVRDLDRDAREGMDALFETIVREVPAPEGNADEPFLMQVSTLGWSDHIGRTGTGRVLQGRLRKGDPIARIMTQWKRPEWQQPHHRASREEWEVTGVERDKATYLWVTRGLESVMADEVSAGDIVTIAGPEALSIGDTIAAPGLEDRALPPLEIEEPTVSMLFLVNSGPFAGQEGTAVTMRQIKARLERELRTNVALRAESSERGDAMKVMGRGELHLAILIEEMRREGMELCVSPPEIITHRDADGRLLEPFEELTIDVPQEFQGVVIEKVSQRKGQIENMENKGSGLVRLEFRIPTRGLIGYRSEFLTDTRGLGIMASRFTGYGPWAGDMVTRSRGSMVSMDTGEATSYSLENLQQRGVLFISPMDPVYEGMIIGENARPGDLPCNPTKRKALTNHRSSTKDQTTVLDVPRVLTLDAALEWIAPDELVEVTPKSVRVRKAVLAAEDRKREMKRTASA